MDNFKKKYPNGVLSFYVQIYCKRKGENNTKFSNKIREAMKSWISLSKAEKRIIIAKYNEYQSNFKKNIAIHLKNTEPYLRSKVIKPTNRSSRSNVYNEEIDLEIHENKTNSSKIQIELNNMENGILHSQNNENSNLHVYDHNHSISNSIDSPLVTSTQLLRDKIISLPEPVPPKIIKAKELFLIIMEKENDDLQWEQLTPTQKKQYQKAVLLIKKNYLKEYTKYLEHLSSNKLFNYHKNIVNST